MEFSDRKLIAKQILKAYRENDKMSMVTGIAALTNVEFFTAMLIAEAFLSNKYD